MTPQEFAARAVGIPWERWRSDWQAMDCFGLIVLYHREVLSIDLGAVPQTDIATGFDMAHGWVECTQEAGSACFMAWRNGAPTHCGIVLPGDVVLHSEGAQDRHGSVRVTRIDAMRRAYGEIKFYKYTCSQS